MMMSSLARVKFIKIKVTFRYHTKDDSNKVSLNLDDEIKYYSCSNFSTKTKKWEKNFWVTKRGNKGITNRGRF